MILSTITLMLCTAWGIAAQSEMLSFGDSDAIVKRQAMSYSANVRHASPDASGRAAESSVEFTFHPRETANRQESISTPAESDGRDPRTPRPEADARKKPTAATNARPRERGVGASTPGALLPADSRDIPTSPHVQAFNVGYSVTFSSGTGGSAKPERSNKITGDVITGRRKDAVRKPASVASAKEPILSPKAAQYLSELRAHKTPTATLSAAADNSETWLDSSPYSSLFEPIQLAPQKGSVSPKIVDLTQIYERHPQRYYHHHQQQQQQQQQQSVYSQTQLPSESSMSFTQTLPLNPAAAAFLNSAYPQVDPSTLYRQTSDRVSTVNPPQYYRHDLKRQRFGDAAPAASSNYHQYYHPGGSRQRQQLQPSTEIAGYFFHPLAGYSTSNSFAQNDKSRAVRNIYVRADLRPPPEISRTLELGRQ